MTDIQLVHDRIDIMGLPGEFADAGMTRDWDRFGSLFVEDGVWSMPHIGMEFVGREQIRNGIECLAERWEFLVQNVHPGSLVLDGDHATGRAYISEIGRFRNGATHLNYSVYKDTFRRTAEGWKFTERVYEVTYHEMT